MAFRKFAAGSAAALMLAQPCLAAEDIRLTAAGERHSAAFAGVNVRVPFATGAVRHKPSARLQLTTSHTYRDVSGATLRSYSANGLEFGLNGRMQPTYYVGGQEVRRTKERLNVNGSTTTWLIVGGIVVAIVVLAAVVRAQPTPGPDDDAFD